MRKYNIKKRYLECVIPALFISGCNGLGGSSPGAPAYIVVTTNLTESTATLTLGGTFAITAELYTNGRTVSDQTIESLSLTPSSNSITFNPDSCVVNSINNSTCHITVTIESNTTGGQYNLTMQNISSSIPLIGSSIPFSVQCNPCTMFVTESTYVNGNLLKIAREAGYAGESVGVYAADYLCDADESKPRDGHSYKAFIADWVTRIPCTTPNCNGGAPGQKNWVLYPDTDYVYYNESKIFTTNESAIYVFGVLSNLYPNLESKFVDYRQYFTGMYQVESRAWVAPIAYSIGHFTCNAWQGSTASSNIRGAVGEFINQNSWSQQTVSVHNAAGMAGSQSSTRTAAGNIVVGQTCHSYPYEHLLCAEQ